MSDRKQYFHNYYLKHREQNKAKTYAWLKNHKEKLGVEKFKLWLKERNAKYRQKLKNKQNTHETGSDL